MISQGLVYTPLPSGIHQLVFHDVQTSTLADFTQHLKNIIDITPQKEIMRLVLYVPAVPSVQYLLHHVRDIKDSRPQRPSARIALIYSQSLQFSLLNIVTRALVRTSTIRLFPRQDEQHALEWLIK